MTASWLDVLRATCEMSSQATVAHRIGYSQAVVSAVLNGTYKGDLRRVQAAVEGGLMNATVECPILGTISRAQCIGWQRRPFTATNPLAVTMYRACRSGCPNSFLTPAADITPAVQPAVTHNTGSRGARPQPGQATSTCVTRPTDRRKRSTHSTGARA